MSTPIQLIPAHQSHELIEVIKGLLDLAELGSLNGLVFGASLRGAQFYCDSAGELHRKPVVALGVVQMLSAELLNQIRRKQQDTIF